ncbi:hypothetical protein U1Q18_027032 [Sarracenia purpurea var. burkii]
MAVSGNSSLVNIRIYNASHQVLKVFKGPGLKLWWPGLGNGVLEGHEHEQGSGHEPGERKHAGH